MNKIVVYSLIGIMFIAGGIYGYSKIDWTPKEEQLAEIEAIFSEELEGISSNKIEKAAVVTSKDNGDASEETSESIVVLSTNNDESTTDENQVHERPDTTEESLELDEEKSDAHLEVSVDDQDSPKPDTEEVIVVKGSEVKDTFIQDKIDEHRDEIDMSDLLVGSDIYNKLDTLYLLDLAEGGLTGEEASEVNDYLDSKLTPGEKQQAWELYSKYVHLMQ